MNQIVIKPWGREYCVYRNEHVAIWVLEITKGAQTSLHAHPHKSTAFVVLRGEIEKHLLRGTIRMRSLDKINVFKGRFHRQRALTDGVVLLEIESPDIKSDIVRLEDSYGREGLPIETPTQPMASDCLQLAYVDGVQRFAGCRLQFVLGFQLATNQRWTVNTARSVWVTLYGGLQNELVTPGEAIDGESFTRLLRRFRPMPESMFLRITRLP